MKPTALFFAPARMLLSPGGNGVRPILPSLDLALRRGALVVLLWEEGEGAEAARWSQEALGGSPFVCAPRDRWGSEVEKVSASLGKEIPTVGVGGGPEDLPWLYATSLRYHAGEGEAPGVTALPGPAPVAWRLAVEEALSHVHA